jgi:glycine/D-amino acid oxidase-like deaminating enzyme
MDLISGQPWWPISNGLLRSYPPLEETVRCDVAVIGGGITGACVADELSRAGLETVVLDRRDVGRGSTSGSTNLLLYEIDTPLGELIRRVGERDAVRSFRLCAEAVERIAQITRRLAGHSGFARRESLYGASKRGHVAHLREEYALRRRHGFDVEFWDEKRVRRESSLPFAAALVSRPAAEVDSYRFAHELLAAAVRRGARVFDRTTVLSYTPHRGGVSLQTDRGHRVRAGRVVVAAGYEAEQFLHRRETRLHATYALVTEPLRSFPGWPGRRLIWETARPYLYLRTTPDNRAIIGGGDVPYRGPTARDRLLASKTRWLERRFRALFPDARLETAYSWTGTFAETSDGLPFIGPHPSFPRAYFALGYGGNGITYSVVAAAIIRDLCLGKRNPDAALFRFGR